MISVELSLFMSTRTIVGTVRAGDMADVGSVLSRSRARPSSLLHVIRRTILDSWMTPPSSVEAIPILKERSERASTRLVQQKSMAHAESLGVDRLTVEAWNGPLVLSKQWRWRDSGPERAWSRDVQGD